MRLATLILFAVLSLRGDTLKEILDRMDADALKFHGVTAQLKRIEYVAAIRDTSEEKATLTMMKTKRGVAALLDFTSPDVKDILFKDGQVQEYLPKLNLIREYDLGNSASIINDFVTLGFGSSGRELLKNYKIDHRGSEVLKIADNEIKATKLELVPKSAEALKYMKRVEFWVPDGKSYSVQLKIYQPSGDTNMAMYSAVHVNPPTLNEHSMELKAPKNAKHEKVNK